MKVVNCGSQRLKAGGCVDESEKRLFSMRIEFL